ncbi:transglutaminase domain-containing protein [Rhodococcus qingshengii]|uniref:transglutaminase domain-containing protein n=1 Tax=Rhodococcus qingshengii TaxID=334542 RepID=UPI0022B44C72|nr:transglutaminase domain-containing protein [Rhodococcus qingshengii]MCZ4613835.1 transglutaminase domain-containing protein [Rhodococcus qingshengii]MDT9662493.1 transglutaminase domain-containing protein [Rhodococcus qingshengii]
MTAVLDYTSAGPFTRIDGVDMLALESLPTDPMQICRVVPYLVVQPTDARSLNLPTDRFDENQIRPASVLLQRLLALDPAPVTSAREPDKRLVGTCRHFAVLSCAFLRYRGIAARVRCGFATYFQPGQGVDHWITEYWDDAGKRWIRIDSEILGQNVLPHAHNLQPGEFLSGGEAWLAYRRGVIDGSQFGVYGTENWGPAEIRGNAVKDLAAMNKVETLPWDEWGRMTDAYDGKTGADYDLLLGDVAAVCAADDPVAVRALYEHDDLRVPDKLIRF